MSETFKCDQCGKECSNRGVLGLHLFNKHGIRPSDPASIARREAAKDARHRAAENKRRAKLEARNPPAVGPTKEPTKDAGEEVVEDYPESVLAYAVGRVEERAALIASENGYGEKPFIRTVAKLFANLQGIGDEQRAA